MGAQKEMPLGLKAFRSIGGWTGSFHPLNNGIDFRSDCFAHGSRSIVYVDRLYKNSIDALRIVGHCNGLCICTWLLYCIIVAHNTACCKLPDRQSFLSATNISQLFGKAVQKCSQQRCILTCHVSTKCLMPCACNWAEHCLLGCCWYKWIRVLCRRAYVWGLTGPYLQFTPTSIGDHFQYIKNTWGKAKLGRLHRFWNWVKFWRRQLHWCKTVASARPLINGSLIFNWCGCGKSQRHYMLHMLFSQKQVMQHQDLTKSARAWLISSYD